MTDKIDDLDVMYYQLVLSMQASAMQHLGKVMSPITGKIERNLDAARFSIDMLEMLQRKTTGNLSTEEKRLLDHVLHDLRLNYVDEVGKKASPDQTAEGASEAESSQETPDAGDSAGHPQSDEPSSSA